MYGKIEMVSKKFLSFYFCYLRTYIVNLGIYSFWDKKSQCVWNIFIEREYIYYLCKSVFRIQILN